MLQCTGKGREEDCKLVYVDVNNAKFKRLKNCASKCFVFTWKKKNELKQIFDKQLGERGVFSESFVTLDKVLNSKKGHLKLLVKTWV